MLDPWCAHVHWCAHTGALWCICSIHAAGRSTGILQVLFLHLAINKSINCNLTSPAVYVISLRTLTRGQHCPLSGCHYGRHGSTSGDNRGHERIVRRCVCSGPSLIIMIIGSSSDRRKCSILLQRHHWENEVCSDSDSVPKSNFIPPPLHLNGKSVMSFT